MCPSRSQGAASTGSSPSKPRMLCSWLMRTKQSGPESSDLKRKVESGRLSDTCGPTRLKSSSSRSFLLWRRRRCYGPAGIDDDLVVDTDPGVVAVFGPFPRRDPRFVCVDLEETDAAVEVA